MCESFRRREPGGVCGAAQAVEPAQPAAPAAFVIGTHQPETTFQGRWVRRIYEEAFRRIGVPLKVAVYPLQRLAVLTDQGTIDGDTARVAAYGAAHPELVRIDESIFDMGFGLWAVDRTLVLARLEDLRDKPWRGIYLRGVAICENTLSPFMPAERLRNVTDERQGLNMLLAGRAELYCGSSWGILDCCTRRNSKTRKACATC